MADNVQSIMLEILKQIQADVSDIKVRVVGLETDAAEQKTRTGRLEDLAKRQRRDTAAILVMMKGTVGVFDERLRDVENDVRIMMEHE